MTSSSDEKPTRGTAADLLGEPGSISVFEQTDLLVGVTGPDRIGGGLQRLRQENPINLALFSSPDALLGRLDSGRPAVIILDDRFIPAGLESFCRDILADEKSGRVFLLILVDSETVADLAPLLKEDRVEFVFKPVRFPELVVRVNTLLAQARSADETAGPIYFSESGREQLRLALKATQTGIWEWDIATNQVTWSEEIPTLFGLAPDEFKGTFEGYMELVHPEDVTKVETAINAVMADPQLPYHIEHRLVWLDGSVHWLEGRGQTVLDEHLQPIYLIGVVSDITARKKTEEELRLSEGRYRLLVEHFPGSATIMFDHELRTILVDGPLINQSGYSKETLEGKKLGELELPHMLFEGTADNLRAVLMGNSISGSHQSSERLFDLNYLPLINPAGEVEYGMLMVQDVTEKRRVEVALQRNEEWLRNILSSNPVIFMVLDEKERY